MTESWLYFFTYDLGLYADLEFNDAEKMNESVDALHDDIDTLINDMDAMGDTMHSDLDDLALVNDRDAVGQGHGLHEVMGDVNIDGSFDIADLLTFKKWMIRPSDAFLNNWEAADFDYDDDVDVFDLILMRKALIEKS